MRYICIECGTGGASGRDKNHLESPASYNCHVCGAKEAMRPYPEDRQKLLDRIAELEQREQICRIRGVPWVFQKNVN